MYSLIKIWHPERFQGDLKKNNYFEGWYFKIADRELENIYAIIPGISYTDSHPGSHCFIQVLDGKGASSRYFRYPLDQFHYSRKGFEIAVGPSIFSAKGMYLDIDDETESISSNIIFDNISPWPKSLVSPGAMGWYSYVPFMECYHGVVSMDHDLKGDLDIDGKSISFEGGKGYIEKDWGSSFPKGWIWMQTNNFKVERTSLMVSIAKIPWKKRSFTGFICGFLLKGKLYVFSTYKGSSIESLGLSEDKVSIIISSRDQRLYIDAFPSRSAVLASPKQGSMDGRINESMDSEIEVRLTDRYDKDIIFEGRGLGGGLEIINPKVLL